MNLQNEILKINISYLEIFFLTTLYFFFLYFIVGYFYQKAYIYLASKGFVSKIRTETYNPNLKMEIRNSIVSIIIFGFSGIAIFYFYKSGIAHFGEETILNSLAGLLMLTLWNEIHFFLIHRMLHLPFLFKKIHFIHHKSRIPNVYSVYSFHWIEATLLSTVPLFIIPFYDFSIYSVVLFPLVSILFNFAGHCNYRFGNGEGSKLKTFGSNHSKHHFLNRGEYGFITPFLDYLFQKLKK